MKVYAILREDETLALHTVYKYESDARIALGTLAREYENESAGRPKLVSLWVDGFTTAVTDLLIITQKD